MDLVELSRQRRDALDGPAPAVGHTQQAGQLVDDDDDGDAAEEADHHRPGQEVADPAQPRHPDEQREQADQERGDQSQPDVPGTLLDEVEGDQPGGQDRRDGAVHPEGEVPVGGDGRPDDGRHQEPVQPGDRRHPGQVGGGQLARHGDRAERHPRHEIPAQPLPAVAPQRREEPELARPYVPHRPSLRIAGPRRAGSARCGAVARRCPRLPCTHGLR